MLRSLSVADDEDPVASLTERRWFAASAAICAQEEECEVLREVMSLAEQAWRRSRTHLAELEALRDAIGSGLREGAIDAAPARERDDEKLPRGSRWDSAA
jgi:hypothetical protein